MQEAYYLSVGILPPISISLYSVTFLDHIQPKLQALQDGFFPLSVHLSDNNKIMQNYSQNQR